MSSKFRHAPHLAAFFLAAALSLGSAWADKPDWAGKNKGNKGNGHAVQQGHGGATAGGHRFDQDSRRLVEDYYGSRFRAGKCPPGLAKKHNGCMPPGQAKKWAMGQPVPRDQRFYDLPKELRSRLPPPPPEHRYVRVASDILLIAIGTRMVVDAIEDIGRVAGK
jgi:Ni/Co efflux regulator RcnB